MTVVYPSLESPEFAQGFKQLADDIAGLAALFDANHVGASAVSVVDQAAVRAFESVLERFNAVQESAQTLGVYLFAFVSTDSRDAVAQARTSELRQLSVRLSQLDTRFTAWIGSLDVEALIRSSVPAREHAYALRRARIEATRLMSPAEEDLAAEMSVTGGQAWAKLWGDVSSQMMVALEREGRTTELPMPALRNLASDPDRALRKQAYDAELAAWQRTAVPLAAAMNGVKGQVNLLARRRTWQSPLDTALFANGIERDTLDAMMTAARESFPAFRRYLRAKARTLKLDKLAWYDIFAPVGHSASRWEFDQAAGFVTEQFATFSPRLRDLAARAFAERWIDAEPRPGKRDGAFCMHLRRDESRVLLNYSPHLGDVMTLAHELGHAYHNVCRAERTPVQRATPMVLAETASIFCETIVRQAALKQADKQEQLVILENELMEATQVVVDITSRFLFEQNVFEKRAQRELSVDELNALMIQAQKDTYGDGLDESLLHPYMWAVKSHYYRPGLSFYNFPYMFGLLFGLGMYACYQADPATFKASYDDLLSSTGMDDVATLAARFGIDVRTPQFWASSLSVLTADVERFESLVG
jgi:pepF/M3 family oligoendopeptidase